MVDKNMLLSQIITVLKEDADKLHRLLQSTKDVNRDAPSRMQSRYDTSKIESSWLSDGLSKTLNDKELAITYLETLHLPGDCNRVCIGSVIGISSSDSSDIVHYFVLPVAGGYIIGDVDNKVTTITTTSPIGKALIGKSVGDEISLTVPQARILSIEELI